jgi:hypothetical protein
MHELYILSVREAPKWTTYSLFVSSGQPESTPYHDTPIIRELVGPNGALSSAPVRKTDLIA